MIITADLSSSFMQDIAIIVVCVLAVVVVAWQIVLYFLKQKDDNMLSLNQQVNKLNAEMVELKAKNGQLDNVVLENSRQLTTALDSIRQYGSISLKIEAAIEKNNEIIEKNNEIIDESNRINSKLMEVMESILRKG